MCGVVGAVSIDTLSFPVEGWFKNALYVDGLRGMDSTGIIKVTSQNDVSIVKKALPPNEFLDLKATDKFFSGANKVLVGHNRWATKGAVNHENAHPFVHEHITLVHNGSLFTHHSLKDGNKFVVDSEAICYSIAHDGAEETIKKLNGSFSLVWWDDQKKTLNFCRNDERPMYLSGTPDEKTCVFASEPEIITWLAGGSHTRNTKFTHEEPIATETGIIYSFCIGANLSFKDKPSKLTLTTKKAELYVAPTYPNYGRGGWDKEERYALRNTRSNKRKGTHNNVVNIDPKSPTPVEKRLNEYGLKKGMSIDFNYLEHSIVGTSDTCVLMGIMPTYPYLPVKVYNMAIPKYAFSEELVGTLSSLIIDNKIPARPELVLDMRSVKVKKYVPDTFLEHLTKEDREDDIMYRGFGNKDITGKEFDTLTKGGCANCQCDLYREDHLKHEWLSSDSVLCQDCAEERATYGSIMFPIH
jgi:hypothetical protein